MGVLEIVSGVALLAVSLVIILLVMGQQPKGGMGALGGGDMFGDFRTRSADMRAANITKYAGIFQSGVVVTTPNKKFTFGLTWVKRGNWKLDFNTIWEFSWLVSKKTNINLFAQYYNGYGEDLLHYNQFRSMLRAGLVFKPKFFSEF